jgi:transposase-like protein
MMWNGLPTFRAPGSPVPVARGLRLSLAADTTEASTRIPDTNPLERLNKEVKRRADVFGIFPYEASMDVPTMLPIL